MEHCSTPGHEGKPQHGRSGLCQACYRRKRRRELDPAIGTRKPGPKPTGSSVPHRKRAPEERVRKMATDTRCANNHPLTPENTYVPPDGQKVVCKVCRMNAQRKYKGLPPLERETVGQWNRDKTECPWGHEYTEENTYFTGVKTKVRHCRKCAREHRLMRTYGLERGQYDAMFEEQSGHCAGCERELEEGRNLAVDHDHKTGAVRQLLCDRCNLVLGSVDDDVELLRRLALYVETHRG